MVFALPFPPVRWLPPAIIPSDLGTTTRESPKPPVLEGHPRCIGRDFDEIFQAAWLVPPWTSRAACGSSQTFSRPFSPCYCTNAQLSINVTRLVLIRTRFRQSSQFSGSGLSSQISLKILATSSEAASDQRGVFGSLIALNVTQRGSAASLMAGPEF